MEHQSFPFGMCNCTHPHTCMHKSPPACLSSLAERVLLGVAIALYPMHVGILIGSIKVIITRLLYNLTVTRWTQ